MSCFAMLLALSARPAGATLIAAARAADVRSVATFCDLLLIGVSGDGSASAEVFDHARFFEVAAGAVPRMDGPDDPGRAQSFVRMNNFAARHGAGFRFVEMVAGLDQVVQITARTLARLNGATAPEVRREMSEAFARQPEIFAFIRTRHDGLERLVHRELDVWIGHAFALEVERLRPTRDLTHLYPPDLRAQLDAATNPGLRDAQLARCVHEQIGRDVLRVFGASGPAKIGSPVLPQPRVADVDHLAPLDPQ